MLTITDFKDFVLVFNKPSSGLASFFDKPQMLYRENEIKKKKRKSPT